MRGAARGLGRRRRCLRETKSTCGCAEALPTVDARMSRGAEPEPVMPRTSCRSARCRGGHRWAARCARHGRCRCNALPGPAPAPAPPCHAASTTCTRCKAASRTTCGRRAWTTGTARCLSLTAAWPSAMVSHSSALPACLPACLPALPACQHPLVGGWVGGWVDRERRLAGDRPQYLR